MKKLLIIILLVIPLSLFSQYKNNLSVSLQPGDLGIGMRYDRLFKYTGAYVSGSIGNYHLVDGSYIHDHIRVAAGGFFYLPERTNDGIYTKVTLGAVYHFYGEKEYNDDLINEEVFFPLSAELGIGTILKRFNCSLRFDILKFEGVIDFGFNF